MPDEELTNDDAEKHDSQPEIPDEGTAENGSEAEEAETAQAEDQEINEPSMADTEAVAQGSEEPEAGQVEDQGEGGELSATDSESTPEASDEKTDQGESLSEEEMAMISEIDGTQSAETSSEAEDNVNKVAPMEFEQFSKTGQVEESHNIDMLLDVTMPVSIELGRTSMPIQDILNLGPGSVVELNKLAGEPVDLLVNEKLIARGEVVVVDENFGIRITSMTSKEDRIKSLG